MGAIYFLFALVGGVVCARMATGKGRNQFAWFVVGCLIPIVGIAVLFVLSDVRTTPGPTVVTRPGYAVPPSPSIARRGAYDSQTRGKYAHYGMRDL